MPSTAGASARTRLEEWQVFDSGPVRVGAFRCGVGHPDFAVAGRISRPLIAFARTSVWIQRQGWPRFVADPGLVTFYNRDQSYSRAPLSGEGDRSDWFSLDESLALEIAAAIDPCSADDPENPFRPAWTPCPAPLYLAQRTLFERLRAREPMEPLAVEEQVVEIVAAALVPGSQRPSGRRAHLPGEARSRRLAQAARAELDARFTDSLSLSQLASLLGASSFRLCRAFRRETGTTVHAHLTQLRLRASLERLAEGEPDITRLAVDLGFSSHSHFTFCFRRAFGLTPSGARRKLTTGGRRRLVELERCAGLGEQIPATAARSKNVTARGF
jgi:AraC-like DNA-binding protein